MGLAEFRRHLAYQAALRGKMVRIVNRGDPSSKMCSARGYKMPKMTLFVREWTCPQFGEGLLTRFGVSWHAR